MELVKNKGVFIFIMTIITTVSETIRKPPLVKAKTALKTKTK